MKQFVSLIKRYPLITVLVIVIIVCFLVAFVVLNRPDPTGALGMFAALLIFVGAILSSIICLIILTKLVTAIKANRARRK
ncbi:hypothetical protein ACFLVP_02195 [Chloroflexota bacterium]